MDSGLPVLSGEGTGHSGQRTAQLPDVEKDRVTRRVTNQRKCMGVDCRPFLFDPGSQKAGESDVHFGKDLLRRAWGSTRVASLF